MLRSVEGENSAKTALPNLVGSTGDHLVSTTQD